VSIESPFTTSY